MRDTILALDSSGRAAGACVLIGGQVACERTLDAGRTHSETLLALADEVLRGAGAGASDIGLYAVTGGPGSFTGLRIGMALVKGMALPAGTPAVAVSTLEALALAATEAAPPALLAKRKSGIQNRSGGAITLVPALDARRGEVYWAAFEWGDGLRRLTPDRAGPAVEIGAQLALGAAPVFFVGDGAEICYTIYDYAPGVYRCKEWQPPAARGAALLGRRLWCAGEVSSAEMLRPHYLRKPQAERERDDRLSGRAGREE